MRIGNKNPILLDEEEVVFFEEECKFIQARAIAVPHKNLKALTLIPVNTDAPSGTKTIVYRYYDGVGVAMIVSDYATDFPRVDTYGYEKTAKVRALGDSYGYSIPEIRRAALNGTPLEQRRANMAARGIAELVDKLAWHGDKDYGIQGFLDYPGITEITVNNGASGHKTFASKTSHEIVETIGDGITAINESTDNQENPDTLALPTAQYNLIARMPMGPEGTQTVLEYIKKAYPQLTRIEPIGDLKGAGAGGTDRFMLYEYNPEKLDFQIPQPYEQFPPQQDGLEFVVLCHEEVGGVIVYFPMSVAFGDGI